MAASAQIIQHPRAVTERVIQTKKCGRHPKSIPLLREARRRQRVAASEEKEIADEIDKMKRMLVVHEQIRDYALTRLARLRQPNMNKVERQTLVEEIRWENLPWREKEAITAMREARSSDTSQTT